METLGTYLLTKEMSAQNSGYSVWAFGQKNGREYFIKQFLSPKYPENDPVASEASIAKRRKKCERFEQKKIALYRAINENSDGNAVRVEEFFRVGTKYYIATEKVNSLEWNMDLIVKLDQKQKRFLCAVVAHALAGLHKGRVVHADLKPDNILFAIGPTRHFTAKIIDFDSGFLEMDPPEEGEEIVGDQVYFSPEACRTCMGEHPMLTCKMDIFALGVLFHQYFTGEVPGFDTNLGFYIGEAVAAGGKAIVSSAIPGDVRSLLERMLDGDPNRRPTAREVFEAFAEKPAVPKSPAGAPVGFRPAGDLFRRAGDL